MEIHGLLWNGLEEAAAAHRAVYQAGTLEVWLDMLPHLVTTSNSHHTLPGPWLETMPDLHGTQL